jgi:hypothetical protein
MPARSVDSAFRLDGKIALVTAAGRGIGRAVALALAAAGAEPLLVSRTPSELDEVAREIAADGGRARPLPFDVTRSDAVRDAFTDLERLDILVNNAGLNRPQAFLEVDEPTLDLLLGLNVRAAFVVAQAAARLMVANGGGVIINVSSQMGHVGSDLNRTVYVMTKHAIEGVDKGDGGRAGAKGRTSRLDRSDFCHDAADQAVLEDPVFHKWVLDRIPLGRLGRLRRSHLQSCSSPRPRRRSSPAHRCSSMADGPRGSARAARTIRREFPWQTWVDNARSLHGL